MSLFYFLKKNKDDKENDNSNYGGFIISKNITNNGVKAKWIFREEPTKSNLNGWYLYSEKDDQDYISNPNNFEIVSASTIKQIVPVLLMIVNAPYKTDLTLKYEQDVVVGFMDTNTGKEMTIDEILK